ncbi:hypothetical protein MKW98_008462 [Papaver atlanticum]|uniref:Uncharacterized protein n=1 Tax=Papaver atlanticum TaxID=357466 RepID=A0AAD4SIL5_9MAGN|nr:hypothetical protein MKW98_008462 [Papaver atlanticum]
MDFLLFVAGLSLASRTVVINLSPLTLKVIVKCWRFNYERTAKEHEYCIYLGSIKSVSFIEVTVNNLPLVIPEAVKEVVQEVKAGKYWFSIYLLKRRILNFWWSFKRVLQEGSDEALFDCFYLMINSGAWWLFDANIPHQKYQY